MTEVVKPEIAAGEPAQPENKQIASTGTAPTARVAHPANRWSIRAAEIKKQKRRAHRRKINASNTPG